MNLLILGATGLVGKNALHQALTHPEITRVVAPTRIELPSHEKLQNPVATQLDTLLPEVASWEVDAVICALGTTIGKAGSKEAFRQVDYDLPLAFGTEAHRQGAETFALVTVTGASVSSRAFYTRTKGELERDIVKVGFKSLAIVRPSVIGGKREESRPLEKVAVQLIGLLGPILPKQLRVNPASKIAEALIRAVVAPQQGCHITHSATLL